MTLLEVDGLTIRFRTEDGPVLAVDNASFTVSGNQLLTVTGRVINPTESEQAVPPLHAQIRTRGGQVVYSWVIDPPARTLAPGASASFNSAELPRPENRWTGVNRGGWANPQFDGFERFDSLLVARYSGARLLDDQRSGLHEPVAAG